VAISYLPTISVIARALLRRARGNLNPFKIVCIQKNEIATPSAPQKARNDKKGRDCLVASLLAMRERSLLAMSRFVLASPPKAGVAISSFAPRSEGVSNVIEVIQSIDRIHTWGKMKMGIENACGKHKCIENSASPQGEVDSPYCLRFFAKEFKGEPSL